MSSPYFSRYRLSVAFTAIAAVCFVFADMATTNSQPWQELARMGHGLIHPEFSPLATLLTAAGYTVLFALLGTVIAAIAGFGMMLLWGSRVVRTFCAFIRAIHELFWALLFLQLFGLSPITGLLAIAVPYSGIFAKVYAEILEEANDSAARALPAGSSHIAALFFTRLPDCWQQMKTYSYYRLECGLRSSAVLGFIGLPTLGFHLESAFAEGYYSNAAACLLMLILLVGTLRWWMPTRLVVPAAVAGLIALPFIGLSAANFSRANTARFFSHDIVPAPLRNGEGFAAFNDWLWQLLSTQAWPGIINTLIVTQIALVATGALALLMFPLISKPLLGHGRWAGRGMLLVLRSLPEYLLAVVLLQLWGPSMLPAVVALMLHNGAIIGFLIGQQSNQLALRPDAPSGVNLYSWEMLPRLYGPFLALLFYRWEILMRETAVLGILGVYTLGFFIDSAIAELRIDRALVLLLVTAMLNMLIDSASRRIRKHLQLRQTITLQNR